MTVSELITLLQKMPQELEVFINDDNSSVPNPLVHEFYGGVWVYL